MYASRFMLLKHTIHLYAMLALAGSVWRHMGRGLTVSDGRLFPRGSTFARYRLFWRALEAALR